MSQNDCRLVPATLIREGSRLLVHNCGYTAALIVRIGENKQPLFWAGAGLAGSADALDTLLARGQMPPCWDRVRSTEEVLLIDDRRTVCGTCPVAGGFSGTHLLGARLTHEGTDHGYLAVVLPRSLSADDEERAMCFLPVKLRLASSTTLQSNHSSAFQFSPPTLTVSFSQAENLQTIELKLAGKVLWKGAMGKVAACLQIAEGRFEERVLRLAISFVLLRFPVFLAFLSLVAA